MNVLLVVLGGALGAPARYLVDVVVRERVGTALARGLPGGLPWGTMTANVLGSLVFGVVMGSAMHGGASTEVVLGVGVGFCGAFTTYSTFAYETFRLAEDRRPVAALANVVLSVSAGLAAAAAGVAVGARAFA